MTAENAQPPTENARVHLFAWRVYFRVPAAWPDRPGSFGRILTPGPDIGAEAMKLDAAIAANLKELGYGG